MPTSRPLVEGDQVIAINLPLSLGESYHFNIRRMSPEQFVLASDFDLFYRGSNMWWGYVGERIFGVVGCNSTSDPRLISAIRRGTAPALYVREGDTVEPWSSYQSVLLERRLRALTERHEAFMIRLRQLGAGSIQLRVEDDIVILQCNGALPYPAILAPKIPEGVRVEALPAQAAVEFEQITRAAYQRLPGSAPKLAEIGVTPPPPPPPPPPPTRFNLLECDLPAVDPTPAKQKHFDALAELQASFRAAKAAAKTTVQPVLTRFDLLECDEPAEPAVVKPKWSAPQRPKQQPQSQQRRTVEDILDLTTSGPLEAFMALQIVKAEIMRDLW